MIICCEPVLQSLLYGKMNKAGRNFKGSITVRRRGSGLKKLNRLVDFYRYIWNCPAMICTIEKDPNRSALIGLISFFDIGILTYIILPKEVYPGDIIINSSNYNYFDGSAMPLSSIPLNTKLNNLEFRLGLGSKLARSAGTYVTLLDFSGLYASLLLNSGKKIKVNISCIAVKGVVSNAKHRYIVYRIAGMQRLRGRRPSVRGVAMNAFDHPHGGGRGKKSGSRVSKSPWKKLGKGQRTKKIA